MLTGKSGRVVPLPLAGGARGGWNATRMLPAIGLQDNIGHSLAESIYWATSVALLSTESGIVTP